MSSEKPTIYEMLSAPFPDEAIERTSRKKTGKGYDTTGIKYQYIVNRMNEVLGLGGVRTTPTYSARETRARSGRSMYEVACDLVMQLGTWADGEFTPFAEATGTGGHASTNEADARKGAYTNGYKKVAAFFGCGWQAYAGELDDDNTPADGELANGSESRSRAAAKEVYDMIVAAQNREQMHAAGQAAKKLDVKGRALVRPAWDAKAQKIQTKGE